MIPSLVIGTNFPLKRSLKSILLWSKSNCTFVAYLVEPKNTELIKSFLIETIL